jgi:hypothetical protein
VISNPVDENEDFSFGLNRALENKVLLRTVLAYKILDYDEMFRYTFQRMFPNRINLSGYDFIFLNMTGGIEDHEQIVTEESLQVPYEKHRIIWNVYAFENAVEFIKCPVETSP